MGIFCGPSRMDRKKNRHIWVSRSFILHVRVSLDLFIYCVFLVDVLELARDMSIRMPLALAVLDVILQRL